jgi:hypothetical protein
MVSSYLMAYQTTTNPEWKQTWTERIQSLVKEHLPSGSGVDSGTRFNWEQSTPDKLVFNFEFHHMNQSGCYDGWTKHKAIVTPSLALGFEVKITGPNRNQIKEYLHEIFYFALKTEVAI